MGVTLDSPWAGEIFAPPTPLDIATLESAIAAQLRAQVTAIEIVQSPDKPAAYRLTHRIGAALVAWRGATYGALIDTAAVVQSRRLEFEIILLVRDLGWSFGADPSGPNPGAYALLEAIRAALTGLRLPGCRKLFPLREQFLGRDPQGGVWTWSALYALETMALEASTQDNFPLFIKGTALEEGGQTVRAATEAAYTFNSQGVIQLPVGNVANLVVTRLAAAIPISPALTTRWTRSMELLGKPRAARSHRARRSTWSIPTPKPSPRSPAAPHLRRPRPTRRNRAANSRRHYKEGERRCQPAFYTELKRSKPPPDRSQSRSSSRR